MAQPQNPRHQSEPPTPAANGGSGARPWFWVLPALAFVVGLALGAVVVAVNDGPDTDNSAAGGAQPTATASPVAPTAAGTPSDRIVTVPASCEEGLDRARTALSTVDQAVDAVRNLDTARLQELLDRLQQARQEVDRLAEQCRREAPDRN